MIKDSRRLMQRLKAEGWTEVRVKGSHHVFRHPGFKDVVVVPHPKKDLPIGTIHDTYKKAGWSLD